MTDFECFIVKNKLKKKDIATYLEVSPAFVTQLVSGQRQVPEEKLALIKANTKWDISMFDTPVISNESRSNVGGHFISGSNSRARGNITYSENDTELGKALLEIEYLKKEVESLKSLVDEKERLITILMKRQE